MSNPVAPTISLYGLAGEINAAKTLRDQAWAGYASTVLAYVDTLKAHIEKLEHDLSSTNIERTKLRKKNEYLRTRLVENNFALTLKKLQYRDLQYERDVFRDAHTQEQRSALITVVRDKQTADLMENFRNIVLDTEAHSAGEE